MATTEEITKGLYDPLKRYYDANGSTTLSGTRAAADSVVLGKEIVFDRPNVKKMMDSLSGQGKDTSKLSDALVNKWEKDKSFLAKLDAELGKDPAAAARLEKAIKADPNKVAAAVNAMGDNQPINLAVIAPVEAAAPSPSPEAKKSAPTAKVVETKPAAHKASHKPAEMVAEEKSRVTSAPAPQTPEQKEAGMKIARGIFEGFADQPDDKISSAIDAGMVGTLATSMSQDAVSKYGVDKGVAAGFARRVNGDPKLSNAIQNNLKNNPDFVRQLAVMSKSDNASSNPLMANAARQKMTEFMANPELLADDRYVRNMTSSMKMANSPQGGIMGMLGNFMQSLGPMFHQMMAGFQNMIAGFTGSRQVFSMHNSNGSMFPTIMVNVANMNANMQQAAAFSRYDPKDMTAYGIKGKDGSLFHEELVRDSKGTPLRDDNGREVTRKLPNTIEVMDAQGKAHKVIPSVGVLMARQEKGSFDARGEWRPGNYQVPVVTGIAENGKASKIDLVAMSPADFDKYKKDMERRSGREFPTEDFTVADAQRSGIYPNVRQGGYMISQVDPRTGAANDPKMVYPDRDMQQPSAQQQQQMEAERRRREAQAANNPEFNIQGNG